jgi:FemAB-related protein (PEP-CTERM system-associated)
MIVCIGGEIDSKAIDNYVLQRESASLYHLYSWKSIIENCFGNKALYLISRNREGCINGVLPFVHIKSVLFGNYFVSMPYFNYGGVLGDDAETKERLISEAIEIARKLKGTHIEFRQNELLENGMRYKASKVSMRIALPKEPEDLWKAIPSKLRSQIRRPEKEGMQTRIGGIDELDGFYDVFSRNMRDLGTPVYPKAFFRHILKNFPDTSWIGSVYYDSVPVASGFMIGFKETMEIPWASSLKKYNKLSPNMLLYWSCLKFSVERGYRSFDFGRSTPGGGTYHFKEQWGAKPFPLYWYYWMKDDVDIPELNPSNPKYKTAIAVWRRLPLAIANRIGPYIVKKLP